MEELIQIRRTRKRHNQKQCPVCAAQIHKTASGGRRKYCCQHCGASLDKQLTCASCNTQRIWRGKQGAACLGCGTPLNP